MPPEPSLELLTGPFRGASAVRKRLLTPRQLQGQVWRRLLRDVYVHASLSVTDEVRVRALCLAVSPGSVIRGRTAAWLYGAWTPAPGRRVPLEVARARASGGGGRQDALVRRLVTRTGGHPWLEDVREIDGRLVRSPHRAAFELMRQRALVESVVVADAFARAKALALPEFWAYVQAHPRWPGVRLVRRALQMATAAAQSPGESRLRMIVLLGGLPEPLVNVAVMVDDELVGYADLLVKGKKIPWVGLEYQGAYHFDGGDQARRDDSRSNLFTARTGIPLLRYHSEHVASGRFIVVRQVCELTGWAPVRLEDRHFANLPPELAW